MFLNSSFYLAAISRNRELNILVLWQIEWTDTFEPPQLNNRVQFNITQRSKVVVLCKPYKIKLSSSFNLSELRDFEFGTFIKKLKLSNFHILAVPWQPNDALFHIQCRNILTSRLIDLQNERNNVGISQRVIEILDSEFGIDFRKLVYPNVSRPLAQKAYTIR